MTKWEEFEEYLFEHDLLNQEFNVHALAEDMGCTVPEATQHIQRYLDAQNRAGSTTLYVLHRRPDTRTTTAIWKVGARTMDVRDMHKQVASDLQRRIERVIEPTLLRIAQKNPRAAERAEATTEVLGATIKLLVSMLDGEGNGERT